MFRSSAMIFLLMAAIASGATQAPSPPGRGPQAPEGRADSAEIAAMRADLTRMRSLVDQMQHNIAFVDTGLTPLKHQFELEIEMWNLVINDMQRRLESLTNPKPRPVRRGRSRAPDAAPLQGSF